MIFLASSVLCYLKASGKLLMMEWNHDVVDQQHFAYAALRGGSGVILQDCDKAEKSYCLSDTVAIAMSQHNT